MGHNDLRVWLGRDSINNQLLAEGGTMTFEIDMTKLEENTYDDWCTFTDAEYAEECVAKLLLTGCKFVGSANNFWTMVANSDSTKIMALRNHVDTDLDKHEPRGVWQIDLVRFKWHLERFRGHYDQQT